MPRYFKPSQAQYYYEFGVILSSEGQQTPTNPFCSHTDPFMAQRVLTPLHARMFICGGSYQSAFPGSVTVDTSV